MRANMRMVARRAGVSVATVSRYYTDPTIVSEATRSRIRQVIESLDYRPNALARGLVKNETKSIGVIMQDINNIFYPAVIRGIEDVCESQDYTIFISNTDSDINKEEKYVNTYLEKRVDGLIFLGTRPVDPSKNEHITKLSHRLPVVVISEVMDTSNPKTRLGCVFSKEEDGAYEAVRYLLALGHRKIAFLTAPSDISTYVKKRKGYERALAEAGIPVRNDLIVVDLPYADGGYRGANVLFDLPDPPTAIMAISDQMAMGVIKAAFERGLAIPGDVSLVGYSGVPISADLFPELTTVDQSPYTMGQKGAALVIDLIKDQPIETRSLALPTTLVIRKSCRAIQFDIVQ